MNLDHHITRHGGRLLLSFSMLAMLVDCAVKLGKGERTCGRSGSAFRRSTLPPRAENAPESGHLGSIPSVASAFRCFFTEGLFSDVLASVILHESIFRLRRIGTSPSIDPID